MTSRFLWHASHNNLSLLRCYTASGNKLIQHLALFTDRNPWRCFHVPHKGHLLATIDEEGLDPAVLKLHPYRRGPVHR
jgi:hypothetical protein